jgi:hypothetical protein
VYVSNDINGAYIVVYKAGQTAPYETITGIPDTNGLALDKDDSFFVGAEPNGVYEVPKGSTTPTHLTFQGLSFVIGVAVSPKGDLLVGSCSNSQDGEILVYRQGQTKPYRTIRNQLQCPYYIGFGPKGELFAAYLFNGNVAIYKHEAKKPYLGFSEGLEQPTSALSEIWPTLQ